MKRDFEPSLFSLHWTSKTLRHIMHERKLFFEHAITYQECIWLVLNACLASFKLVFSFYWTCILTAVYRESWFAKHIFSFTQFFLCMLLAVDVCLAKIYLWVHLWRFLNHGYAWQKRMKAVRIVMKVCIPHTYCTLFHTIVTLNSFFSVLAVPLTNKNLWSMQCSIDTSMKSALGVLPLNH